MRLVFREGVSRVKFKKKDWRSASKVLMGLAVVGVVLAAWGFLAADVWLASTQWLLISVVLAAFGLYARMES